MTVQKPHLASIPKKIAVYPVLSRGNPNYPVSPALPRRNPIPTPEMAREGKFQPIQSNLAWQVGEEEEGEKEKKHYFWEYATSRCSCVVGEIQRTPPRPSVGS
jgi:hypothetical protein